MLRAIQGGTLSVLQAVPLHAYVHGSLLCLPSWGDPAVVTSQHGQPWLLKLALRPQAVLAQRIL